MYLGAYTLAVPPPPPNEHGGPGAACAVSPEVKANVTATINQWLSDIEAVNTFVDTARSSDGSAAIASQAAKAFIAAQNEGASNTILQNEVELDASGQAAAQALIGMFNIIGPAINDTIENPGNLDENLAKINGARCPPPQGAGAISEEAAVQQAAALAVGINAPFPDLPKACAAMQKNTPSAHCVAQLQSSKHQPGH